MPWNFSVSIFPVLLQSIHCFKWDTSSVSYSNEFWLWVLPFWWLLCCPQWTLLGVSAGKYHVLVDLWLVMFWNCTRIIASVPELSEIFPGFLASHSPSAWISHFTSVSNCSLSDIFSSVCSFFMAFSPFCRLLPSLSSSPHCSGSINVSEKVSLNFLRPYFLSGYVLSN